MADVMFASHLSTLSEKIKQEGYINVFETKILHDPSSLLPNRNIPGDVVGNGEKLKEWSLFHVSDPPPALLLTLSSRVKAIYIYPTTPDPKLQTPQAVLASTAISLRRRYALLTSLSTTPIFGILINTLSVSNYLSVVTHIQSLLSSAGKKSYTFVVGKVNAAKVANFSEVGGWVVVGCWESSLVESKDFWKPVITPFELELVLKGDKQRLWTGEWRADFQNLLDKEVIDDRYTEETENDQEEVGDGSGDFDSEEESAPPEFDLRTGRYISHTRPMRSSQRKVSKTKNDNGASIGSNSLVKRAKGDLAVIGGEVSPGAEFLRSNRTWRGLGSDFEIAYDEPGNEEDTLIEQGRSGIARGYINESHD